MELGWWRRDEEHGKHQVHLRIFGGKLVWRRQMKRFSPWEPYVNPDDEDWERALELAENRLQRRLTTKDVVDMIRRRETH
ncbi:MAG TPA: hypothetical protein VGA56_19100 [Opitutaceae bacterium]